MALLQLKPASREKPKKSAPLLELATTSLVALSDLFDPSPRELCDRFGICVPFSGTRFAYLARLEVR